MEKVPRITVEHVANLARMYLSKDEIARFEPQLASILSYIDKLKEVDTSGVNPTSHVLPLMNVYREDKLKTSTPQEDVLMNAPDKEKDFFRVPKVIEG